MYSFTGSECIMDKEKVANQWDKVYDDFRGGRLSVWRETASPFITEKFEFLKRQGRIKMLDAGCGDGRNLIELAEAGFDVTGVDVSDSALRKCEKNCSDFPDVRLKKMSLEKLDLKEGEFDVVACDFVTAHLENPGKVIENFYRVLKKGGFLLIEFTSTDDPHCGQGERIGENEFLQDGAYLRFYMRADVEKLMRKFKIISIDSYGYTDPDHGPGYHRKERHNHHSFFVFARKK
ncbi:MAG: methyltransferase domain-containing protein [Candidatus Diapherotrites archaeon]